MGGNNNGATAATTETAKGNGKPKKKSNQMPFFKGATPEMNGKVFLLAHETGSSSQQFPKTVELLG